MNLRTPEYKTGFLLLPPRPFVPLQYICSDSEKLLETVDHVQK
jgi:hypothetical protein